MHAMSSNVSGSLIGRGEHFGGKANPNADRESSAAVFGRKEDEEGEEDEEGGDGSDAEGMTLKDSTGVVAVVVTVPLLLLFSANRGDPLCFSANVANCSGSSPDALSCASNAICFRIFSSSLIECVF